eukprot:TRINITY_DN61979_c0_g1_i1.p2 TRINITY_DN61979_c0_g1~~TRINITY_DN61979_c0_g1_i1.p2  ORF type:complete len:184 (+),score=28.39 TRINITY_DN61979_c0_g1_i1:28-579(+)
MCIIFVYFVLMLLIFFFFFKQKTAYEMLRSLVGSEMCIRDRGLPPSVIGHSTSKWTIPRAWQTHMTSVTSRLTGPRRCCHPKRGGVPMTRCEGDDHPSKHRMPGDFEPTSSSQLSSGMFAERGSERATLSQAGQAGLPSQVAKSRSASVLSTSNQEPPVERDGHQAAMPMAESERAEETPDAN